jgi:hypothetical protein
MKKQRLLQVLAISAALLFLSAAGVMAQDSDCEWIDETAWADGTRYVDRGNWATYTAYFSDEAGVILYAGRYLDAGTVSFSGVSEDQVTITITLNEGWRFAVCEDDNNVKIQDYDELPPAINPRPGRFDTKSCAEASPFEIVVPANDYYGIHVNLEWQYCPEPDPEI